MPTSKPKAIYTIGHSTRSWSEFLALLETFSVRCVVDVRRFPGSRKYPHFNQDALRASLEDAGIRYAAMEALGGRRKVQEDSINTLWRNASFQGYADYMETDAFGAALQELIDLADKKCVAIMCAEAVWWRCHRSMISDVLKAQGWTVLHIVSEAAPKEHPYTSPARVCDGEVFYSPPDDAASP